MESFSFRDFLFHTIYMRITIKTGILAALTWIIFKMTFFYLDIFQTTNMPAVLLNLLGLLVSISVGLFLQKSRNQEETSMMEDVKNAMSAGFPYVVIVTGFIYFFYTNINTEYYAHEIAEKDIAIEKMVDDPKQLNRFKNDHPEAEVMTNKQIENQLKESNKRMASVGFTATLSLLALLILATIYSLFVTVVYRKIMFKRM